MMFDYESLLVIGVLLDLNLKEFLFWVIWERYLRFF